MAAKCGLAAAEYMELTLQLVKKIDGEFGNEQGTGFTYVRCCWAFSLVMLNIATEATT